MPRRLSEASPSDTSPSLRPHPSVVRLETSTSTRVVLVAEVELDLYGGDHDIECKIPDIPLPGDWSLQVRGNAQTDQLRFAFAFGLVHQGAFGANVTSTFAVDHVGGAAGDANIIHGCLSTPLALPHCTSSGKLFSRFISAITSADLSDFSDEHDPTRLIGMQRYRVTCELDGVELTSKVPKTSLSRAPRLDLYPNPHNVRLFFPASGADLWASSDFLARSSPYFKTLLSSDFAEAVTVPAKRARTRRSSAATTAAEADANAKDFDDSDDETDGLYFAAHPPQLSEADELQHPYKEIKITKTAFSAYRAVLAYLRTGHIAFAPLSATFTADPTPGAPVRSELIEAAAAKNGSRPWLVSPRSGFRLAHRLGLDDLQTLCLSRMRESLTPETALHELFSDISVKHASWRNTVVDFIVKNWVKVCATDAWKVVQEKVDADEIPGAAPIMMRLLLAKDGKKCAVPIPLV